MQRTRTAAKILFFFLRKKRKKKFRSAPTDRQLGYGVHVSCRVSRSQVTKRLVKIMLYCGASILWQIGSRTAVLTTRQARSDLFAGYLLGLFVGLSCVFLLESVSLSENCHRFAMQPALTASLPRETLAAPEWEGSYERSVCMKSFLGSQQAKSSILLAAPKIPR